MILETSRLRLRPFTLGDAHFLLQLMNDPGWLEHIGNKDVKIQAQAQRQIQEKYITHYQTHGYGLWGVCSKQDTALVGMCGFVKRSYLMWPDLGFAFLQSHTGQGLAYEASQGCLVYAQNTFDWPKVLAITTHENQASRQLLHKLGFGEREPAQSPDGTAFVCFERALNRNTERTA